MIVKKLILKYAYQTAMYERHRRHSHSAYSQNEPYSFSNKHRFQADLATGFNRELKYGKQNSQDVLRYSRQQNLDIKIEKPILQQSNRTKQSFEMRNQLRRVEKKYYWDRPTKQIQNVDKQRIQQIPSFGNTIRQNNVFQAQQQRNIRQRQNLLDSDFRNSRKFEVFESQQIDRYSAKSWDKPISSNMRSQQLKQISKQRVLNIDKINCKIKNILDKLNEQQDHYPIQQIRLQKQSRDSKQYSKAQLRNPLRASTFINYGQQKMSRQKRIKTQYQDWDSPSLKKQLYFRNFQRQKSHKSRQIYDFSNHQSRLSYLNSNQIQASSNNYQISQQNDINRRYTPKKKQKKQASQNYDRYKVERQLYPGQSKEQLMLKNQSKHKLKKEVQNTQINRALTYVPKSQSRLQLRRDLSQHRLKSGKNLEAQIQKIQARILKSKRIKSQLCIEQEEIPYKKHNKCQFQFQRKDFSHVGLSKNPIQQPNQEAQPQEISLPKPFLIARNRATKREIDRSQLFTNGRFNQQNTEGKYQNDKSQNRRILQIQFSPTKSTHRGQRKDLQAFIQNIQKQIQYDSELRNAKKWFQRYLMNTKWQKVQILLRQKGFYMDIQQVKDNFSIDEDQVNPFFSSRQANLSLQDLANAYVKSCNFWNQSIQRNSNREKLIKDGFIQRNLDLDKKGTITIEDFIRFINFQGNTFYRTRDMILIFKRVSRQFQTSFENLLDIFCQ